MRKSIPSSKTQWLLKVRPDDTTGQKQPENPVVVPWSAYTPDAIVSQIQKGDPDSDRLSK
jgi:hypothetical protein